MLNRYFITTHHWIIFPLLLQHFLDHNNAFLIHETFMRVIESGGWGSRSFILHPPCSTESILDLVGDFRGLEDRYEFPGEWMINSILNAEPLTQNLITRGLETHHVSNTRYVGRVIITRYVERDGCWQRVTPTSTAMTPTSVAMLCSSSFDHWRRSLQECGIDLTVFVEEECGVGLLTAEGWDESSLDALFKLNICPEPRPRYLECPACGFDWHGPLVEVQWYLEIWKLKAQNHSQQLHMQTNDNDCSVRRGTHDSERVYDFNLEKEVQAPYVSQNEEQEPRYCECLHTFEWLCLPCWNDFSSQHSPRDHYKIDIPIPHESPISQFFDGAYKPSRDGGHP